MIIDIIYSKRDTYGNCYFALRATDPATGKTAEGKISGGESNIRGAEFALRGRWPETGEPRWYITEHCLPIRQFNALTKSWPYAGCTPEDILKFIQENTKGEISIAAK